MNRVTIAEAKQYLGLDGGEQDKLLTTFLSSAEHIVEKVLRKPITIDTPEIVRTAILFVVWQMYFHRDNSEFNTAELENTLAVMLSDIRRAEF